MYCLGSIPIAGTNFGSVSENCYSLYLYKRTNMTQKHGIPDEVYIEAYGRLRSLTKISYELKVPDVTVYRRCKKLGLEFKNGGHNKGKKMIRFKTSDILEGKHPTYPTGKVKNRIIEEKIFPYECNKCGITEWNGNPIVLQLDHKDGNGKNHKKNNLRLICPNCHSQTETYCGKNKRNIYMGL